jgi:hypothetical protein
VVGISDFALILAVGAALTFVATVLYPTRSKVRQGLTLAAYAIITAGALFYLTEREGLTHVLDPAWRDYVIVGVLGFIGAGVMVLTFDLYLNFDTLKDDPAYAMAGRSGLAVLMLMLAISAMTAVSIAWYQVDPEILVARSNIVFWREAGAQVDAGDFFAFALDQTQKALLFDISEVYSVGLIDIGNNPAHLAFSTACLVYRTFLSVFVIAIAVRLLRPAR